MVAFRILRHGRRAQEGEPDNQKNQQAVTLTGLREL